jgi:cobalt-zinc-cadmium efflux system protein
MHTFDSRKRLSAALAVTAVFFVLELTAGFLTHSLALLSDAGHMLTDAGALAMSLFGLWLKERPATPQRTFGYQRTEVLVATANGLALWAAVGIISREAVLRLLSPRAVHAGPMLGIATVGLLANLMNMWLLKSDEHNLNLRSAYLHVLSDCWGSIGAIIAGVIILRTGWLRIDPIVSLLIGLLILRSSWGLLRDSFHVLMEGAPRHLDPAAIEIALKSVPGVLGVHDLHVWTITSGFDAMSGHLTIADFRSSGAVLRSAQQLMRERFSISHVTLQIEEGPTERVSVV